MKSDNIMVSICCAAYNQEQYIRQALDSFVMQKTNFLFEIIIHDDASTDKTTEIIREYEKKYPDLIFPVYQSQNQFSQGGQFMEKFVYPKARGKYIALCDGDDYWTDISKLQKQIDFLETHPDYSFCGHRYREIFHNTQEISEAFPLIKKMNRYSKRVLTEYLTHTSTFVFRNDKRIWETKMDVINGDHLLAFNSSLIGKIHILPDIMSMYRLNEGGVWSGEIIKGGAESVYQKNALKVLRLSNYIWTKGTNKNLDFAKQHLFPLFSRCLKILIKNEDYEQIHKIMAEFPETMTLVEQYEMGTGRKDSFFYLKRKLKKWQILSYGLILVILILLGLFCFLR